MTLFLLAALAAASAPVPPAAAQRAPVAQMDVPVLNRGVEQGEPLSAADFSVEKRPAGAARGAMPIAAMAGLQVTRRLAAGAVVREGDLARPQLVRRGETVTIALHDGGLAISTTGRALTGGGMGDPVRVVSLATNRTLEGTIEGSGRVRLAGR